MSNRENDKKKAAEQRDLMEKKKQARQAVAILEIQHWLWTEKYTAMLKKKKKKSKCLYSALISLSFFLSKEKEVIVFVWFYCDIFLYYSNKTLFQSVFFNIGT